MIQLPASATTDRIWLNHFKLGDFAVAKDSDWPVMREGLDTAFFAINTVWPKREPILRSIPPEVSAAAAARLHASGVRIGVECGYFDHPDALVNPNDPGSEVISLRGAPRMEPGIGDRTARVEIAKLRPLWQAGHAPDFIVLDDPMRRLTIPGQDTPGNAFQGMKDYPHAAREVVAYMRRVREKFPEVRFVVILNFPNWGWKGGPAFHISAGRPSPMNWGDAHEAMETLFEAVTAAGERIHALQGDFPWRYFAEPPTDAVAATVDWPGRILELERYAREKGARFHLTANSEAGYVSARSFAEDSLAYLDAYRAHGGRPDHFVVQSWYPHPENLMPETIPYTGGWVAARFIERLRQTDAKPVALQVGPRRALDRTEPNALLDLLQLVAPERWSSLSPQVRNEWLDARTEIPPSRAAMLLTSLRETVAESSRKLPGATILLSDESAVTGRGQPPLSVSAGSPGFLVIDVLNTASRSLAVEIWRKDAALPRMRRIWVPQGGFRKIAVATGDWGALSSLALCIRVDGRQIHDLRLPLKPGA